MRGIVAGLILVLLGAYFVDNYLHARHPPGRSGIVLDPDQGPIGKGAPWKLRNGNEFTPLAEFHLEGAYLRD